MRYIKTSGLQGDIEQTIVKLMDFKSKLKEIDGKEIDELDYYEIQDIRKLVEELTNKIENSELG